MATITKPLIVYRPDTRGVVLSRLGLGNLKIGPGVYTYSRLPGRPSKAALGYAESEPTTDPLVEHPSVLRVREGIRPGGTCPGSSPECEAICYAERPVGEAGTVEEMWRDNSGRDDVPEIPEDAKLMRLHVSGDFDTEAYVHNWFMRLLARPEVKCWIYTRSWRVAELLSALEDLRALPNVQMFASIDRSITELPPEGWRRAWIDGDPRAGKVHRIMAHTPEAVGGFEAWELQETEDHVKALLCPEETKAVQNCVECGFCWKGQRNDVVFLQH